METLPTHEMRITSHGKIHSFVKFGLKHFKTNPDVPLVLHTLPALAQTPVDTQDDSGSRRVEAQSPMTGKERIPPSAANVPRLISVVEIIKREFLKQLDSIHQENGKLTGLYQYSRIGCLPDSDPEEDTRANALTAALQGKNHLKIKKIPYMKVVLSSLPLNEIHIRGFTSQEPSLRRLPRSTIARAKRRRVKQNDEENIRDDEGMPVDPTAL